jgi:uncharacterized protein
VVLLEEVGGTHQLPIWIGNWEGESIALMLEKVKVPRPLTHAFTASLLRAGGLRVSQVRVHRLAGETFYAEVELEGPSGVQAVDGRPSDCIALALELDVPIYVAPDVLTAADAAARAKANQPCAAEKSIGAAEIVSKLLADWPGSAKPTLVRGSSAARRELRLDL